MKEIPYFPLKKQLIFTKEIRSVLIQGILRIPINPTTFYERNLMIFTNEISSVFIKEMHWVFLKKPL